MSNIVKDYFAENFPKATDFVENHPKITMTFAAAAIAATFYGLGSLNNDCPEAPVASSSLNQPAPHKNQGNIGGQIFGPRR